MGNKKYIILIFNCLALEKKFSVQTKCLPSKYFPYVKKCTFTVGIVKVLCKKNRPFHWGKLYFSVFRAILRIREESKAWQKFTSIILAKKSPNKSRHTTLFALLGKRQNVKLPTAACHLLPFRSQTSHQLPPLLQSQTPFVSLPSVSVIYAHYFP